MAFLLAVGGAAIGAVLGYLLRYREWLRDRRLLAYTDFIAAFSVVTRKGVVARARIESETFTRTLNEYKEAGARFGSLRAQVSLLATERTDTAAQHCIAFVTGDLYPSRHQEGEEEREAIQWKGLALEQSFLEAARRELGPHRFLRRGDTGSRKQGR